MVTPGCVAVAVGVDADAAEQDLHRVSVAAEEVCHQLQRRGRGMARWGDELYVLCVV